MPKNTTEILFRLGLLGKGVDSVFEIIGGIILTMPNKLARWVTLLSQHEVYRHHNALAGRLDNLAATVGEKASMLEAVYLMVHGAAKVALILAIIARKRWGYTGLIGVLSLFTTLELGRAITAREVVTGLLGAIDLAVIVIIYKEYRQRYPSEERTPE
jgi:uncharacterized membrane protein